MTVGSTIKQLPEPEGGEAPNPRAARAMVIETGLTESTRLRSLGNAADLAAFAQQVESSLQIEDINHDLKWLGSLEQDAKEELWIVAGYKHARLAGLALLLSAPGSLEYSFGSWVFLRWQVRRFQMYRGPLIAKSPDCEVGTELFEAIAGTVPAGSVVYASSVPIGSPMARQLREPGGALRRHFFVLPWGNETLHCRIRWEGSLESYLRSIGHESRRNLKRYDRKLFQDPMLTCVVARFETPAEADVFLHDAGQISERTYQYKLHGLGLPPDSSAEKQVRIAAEENRFLGHVLYVNRRPAAFHYGVIRDETLFVLQMGYDPRWARHQIGSVLFFQVLKDLERTNSPVRQLDYMSGVTTFKLRTTNDQLPVRNYYLFKRTPIGAVQYVTLLATNRLSELIGAVLKGLQLKEHAQRFIGRMLGHP